MINTLRELPGLYVTVDSVIHIPEADTPPDKPFAFRYDLSIHNKSQETITIQARKWVVTNEQGEKLVVEGDGVVGVNPHLEPGETFSYHSFHLIDTPSIAEGAYFGTTEEGEKIMTKIPSFNMKPPISHKLS
ncbi:MAG: ApaG domain [Verrucomicrobiae bacterium]|nr:ApaG domain [Verrucomicrobiae bacterium]